MARVVSAVVAGFVGGALAPAVLNSGMLRTAAKGTIKVGLALFEAGREQAALFGESASDLFAEALEERNGQAPSVARRDEEAAREATAEPMKAHG